MIKVMFVCHGNICRSPMAEFLFKDMVKKLGIADKFKITSSATSTEEIWNGIGNPVHPGTVKKLSLLGISCSDKRAVQITKADYQYYDYIICMDNMNLRNIHRICGEDIDGKIFKMLSFCGENGDVADPWYTGNFDETYYDINRGLNAFLEYLKKQREI